MNIEVEMPRKTYCLLRRLKRKQAVKFIEEGEIRFSKPSKWIEYYGNGNDRIGDENEGVYAAIPKGESLFCPYKRNNTQSYVRDEVRYFRSTDILNLPTLCFYGINDTAVSNKNVDVLWHKQDIGEVPMSFFSDTSNNISKKEYDSLPFEEQPVIVMISRPELFIDRLLKAFSEVGINKDCIFLSPVCYLDKTKGFVSSLPFPFELFLKDSAYSNQSEIRIVIDSTNVSNMSFLSSSVIQIGNISDIAQIQDMYFKSMKFAVQDGKKLVYELSKEIVSLYMPRGNRHHHREN